MSKFDEDGFLVFRGLLDPCHDLKPLIDEYAGVLDRAAIALLEKGKISSIYADLPFGRRVARIIYESNGDLHKYLDISLPQKGITLNSPMHCGPAVFNLIRNPKLLDMVERFIGPEITSNPTQHVRIKPPTNHLKHHTIVTGEMATTVWHQDLGTLTPDADDTNLLTVWIAVTEATRHNGCLLVAPGSHRRGLAPHCHDALANYSRQAIPELYVGSKQIPLEMQPGDVLILHKLTMHASLENQSEDIRWSLDLRYNPTGQATGRAWFPSFVARARAEPKREMQDPAAWAALWKNARNKLVKNAPASFQRWSKDDPKCA